MQPCHFGPSDHPLFGIHHPPGDSRPRADAVLLCGPMGQEYMRTHWAVRRLARVLSLGGLHVLRFDYSGTGDSAGRLEDTTFGQWGADVRAAAEELLAASGATRLHIVGLRVGAAIAAVLDDLPVDRLVLWDPIVRGDAYLDELSEVHEALFRGATALPAPTGYRPSPEDREFAGYRFSQTFLEELSRFDLTSDFVCQCQHLSVLVSANHPHRGEIEAWLDDGGRADSLLVLPADTDYQSTAALERALLPANTFERILGMLRGETS